MRWFVSSGYPLILLIIYIIFDELNFEIKT